MPDIRKPFGLTFAQILSILALCGGLVWSYADNQASISAVKTEIANIKADLNTHKSENSLQFRQYFTDTKEEFTKVNTKLDRLLENYYMLPQGTRQRTPITIR